MGTEEIARESQLLDRLDLGEIEVADIPPWYRRHLQVLEAHKVNPCLCTCMPQGSADASGESSIGGGIRSPDQAVVREIYDVVERHQFADYQPPDLSRAEGTVDLHVHVGPGRQDPLALAKHASNAGVRALVLKNPFLGSTVELANAATKKLLPWAEREGVTPVALIPGVVLNEKLGGLSAEAVDQALAAGAGVIWFPVLEAANHLERAKGMDSRAALEQGVVVLEGNNLTSQAAEVMARLAESDAAVSFGHLSAPEILALAEEAERLGIDRAFVDHPLSPVANLTLDEMSEIAGHGVTCNFTYWELSPYCGVSARDLVKAIRNVGVASASLCSDAGMEIFPDSVECMRLHGALLDVYGFSAAEQETLLSGNPRRLLGI